MTTEQPGTATHDPYDPYSPAADFHQGSPETMDMLNPVPIIFADAPDMPTRLPDVDSEDELEEGDHVCSDPERDDQVTHAQDGGYL